MKKPRMTKARYDLVKKELKTNSAATIKRLMGISFNTVYRVKNTNSFAEYIDLVQAASKTYTAPKQDKMTSDQTPVAPKYSGLFPTNDASSTFSGYLMLTEKQHNDLDFIVWRIFQKEVGDSFTAYQVLKMVVNEAKSPQELFYLTYKVARHIERLEDAE